VKITSYEAARYTIFSSLRLLTLS